MRENERNTSLLDRQRGSSRERGLHWRSIGTVFEACRGWQHRVLHMETLRTGLIWIPLPRGTHATRAGECEWTIEMREGESIDDSCWMKHDLALPLPIPRVFTQVSEDGMVGCLVLPNAHTPLKSQVCITKHVQVNLRLGWLWPCWTRTGHF